MPCINSLVFSAMSILTRRTHDLEENNMKEKKEKKPICEVCDNKVFFNLPIYKLTGMCGTCSTGEARLNYEEE